MLKFSATVRNIMCLYERKHFLVLKSAKRIKTANRNLHCESSLCAKMYMEHENKFAYRIMESRGYSNPLNLPKEKTSTMSKDEFDTLISKDWYNAEPKETFEMFSRLADYCNENNIQISDKMFDNFIDCLTDNIRLASDEELKTIFYSLAKWPEPESVRLRNFIEVWAALDDECVQRIQRWNFDERLNFVSLFYMLNITRTSDFTFKCTMKLASKAKQLSPGQLVQTLFYIGVQRKPPPNMHDLELHLDSIFSEFSVEELAIMAMGFFKSKAPIRNMELVEKLVMKVIENSKNIHEVSLAALLKVIRYSMKIPRGDIIYKLLETLQHEAPRLSVMCNVHLALVGTTTLTLHKGCLIKIAESVMANISKCRLKDLERLVLTYGTFNFNPLTKECFFDKIVEELKNPQREEEIKKFGRSYTCCIAYLGLLGIYPVDLMSKVLAPEFLRETYGRQCYVYGREVLTIHNTSLLFCKEAKMNRLEDKVAKILAKKYTGYVPNPSYNKQLNRSEKLFIDILNVIKDYRGEGYVVGDHILTHHQRGDIIFCDSKDGLPMPVDEVFNVKKFGLIRPAPNDGNNWIVLVIAGRNALIQGSDIPSGHIQTKIRELKALGYCAAFVPWTVYIELETTQEKYEYLSKLWKESISAMSV